MPPSSWQAPQQRLCSLEEGRQRPDEIEADMAFLRATEDCAGSHRDSRRVEQTRRQPFAAPAGALYVGEEIEGALRRAGIDARVLLQEREAGIALVLVGPAQEGRPFRFLLQGGVR